MANRYKKDDEFNEDDERYILKLVEKYQSLILHEYIHYIHEVSTLIGSFSSALHVSLRSIFSQYLDKNPGSCEAFGFQKNISKFHQELYDKTKITIKNLTGDVILFKERTISKILEIKPKNKQLFVLENKQIESGEISIPELNLLIDENGKFTKTRVKFGSFFMYEGIAYELDRTYERINRKSLKIIDHLEGTEYTVLRLVAKYICPKITTRDFLNIAVLSLNYNSCGYNFISFLESIKELNSQDIKSKIEILKNEVSSDLAIELNNYISMQNDLKESFKGREYLYTAMEFLTDQNIDLYKLRIQNPCFEVDNIYNNDIAKLRNEVNICDYMFIFKDRDEYLRDYFGSLSEHDISLSLKVLATHDHYFIAHTTSSTSQVENKTKGNEYRCPIYTCCGHSIRQSDPYICNTKPWRSYEKAFHSKNFCIYGMGVFTFKAVNTEAV